MESLEDLWLVWLGPLLLSVYSSVVCVLAIATIALLLEAHVLLAARVEVRQAVGDVELC